MNSVLTQVTQDAATVDGVLEVRLRGKGDPSIADATLPTQLAPPLHFVADNIESELFGWAPSKSCTGW